MSKPEAPVWSINQHFQWEARLILIVAIGPFVVAVVVWAVIAMRTWLAVDRCLDSGGAYDYANETCTHLSNAVEAPLNRN